MKSLAHRSQELVLRPQVALHNRVFNRIEAFRRGERGQTSIEYLGIIVVVGLIAVALVDAGPGWAKAIHGKINGVINEVIGGGKK